MKEAMAIRYVPGTGGCESTVWLCTSYEHQKLSFVNPHASLSRHTRYAQRSRSLASISAVQHVVTVVRLHAEGLTNRRNWCLVYRT